MADEATTDVARKPFAAFLQEHRNGSLHAELGEVLAELVLACQEHGKKGSLIVRFDVAPNKDGLTVTISDKVDVKKPEGERGGAIWFSDEHGGLSRRHPGQQELPLREVAERKAVS